MMHNILRISSLLLIAGTLNAAEGDTLRIQSHQETHWDWNGSKFDTTAFPDTGSYRRILMYYTLGCPSQGCSEWDYTTRIEVEDKINDSLSRWVELTRIMTPYAGDKNKDWKHTWIIDVTDYAPLLMGDRVVRAHYDGWQDGFTITINFDFIEGTPPREVLEVQSLYDGTYRYGFANDPIEDHLVPTGLLMHQNMKGAKFRLVASGHSFGGNENCAEFCQKYYRLNINGSMAVQEDVWRDDCGSNALEGQTGTWIYNRAGWCPGDLTKRFDTDISNMVDAGETEEFNVDWEGYNYTGGAGFDPQYIIEATVFQYGGWNFENDLAIDEVIRPSKNDRVWEYNPACNNPEIVITNTGSENITRATFKFWVEGSPDVLQYEYKGFLLPGASANVVLPSYDRWLFGGKTKNVFHVEVSSVNQQDDDYAGNNHFKSAFENTKVLPGQFIIAFTNNNAGSETKYKVLNDRGDVVFERTTATSTTLYYDTVSLDTGCYTLLIEDQGCDGLSFFANNDGNGRIWLHNADAATFYPPLHQFDPEFGCEALLAFTVGYELGAAETMGYPEGIHSLEQAGKLLIYPNPSQGQVTIVPGENVPADGEISLYNNLGQLLDYKMEFIGAGFIISDLKPGNYYVRYRHALGVSTGRVVVVQP